MDDARRNALRQLELCLANAHSNLLKSVLFRIPHLTHLTIQVPHDLSPQALSRSLSGIARLGALQHLKLQFALSTERSTQLWSAYLDAIPSKARFSVESGGRSCYDLAYKTNLWCVKGQITIVDLPRSIWPTISALELMLGRDKRLSWNDEILEGLQEAIANDVCRNLSC